VLKESKRSRIPLGSAFRWVLERFEILRGVDPGQRLGLAHGGLLTASWPPKILAKGPGFESLLAVRYYEERKTGPVAQRPPMYVPDLPGEEHLMWLLVDHESDIEATSMAERCLCWAHKWLLEALQSGGVAAWGDQYIEIAESFDGQGNPAFLREGAVDARGRPATSRIDEEEVPQGLWEGCSIDYRNETASSRDRNWRRAAGDGYMREGFLRIENVVLDRAGLEKLLPTIGTERNRVEAELTMEAAGGDETWVLRWNGTECRIAVAASNVPLSRGMRAIAILLRHPDVRTSYFLLDGLKRKTNSGRPNHGRLTDPRETARLDRLREKVDPLGQAVFDKTMDVKAAHAQLLQILLASEKNRFPEVATWSPRFVAKNGKPLPLSDDGQRVGESVRDSLAVAYAAIEKCGREVGKLAADCLRRAIGTDKYSCWFDSGREPVDWSVKTPPGDAGAYSAAGGA
jgi:hypothetical protein